MRDQMMRELVKDDGLPRGPALPDDALKWDRDDAIPVVRTARTCALTHADWGDTGPLGDDADEPQDGIDVALDRLDIGEAPLDRHLKRGPEEVDATTPRQLTRPLILGGVHG
jgi:hypothetical protein